MRTFVLYSSWLVLACLAPVTACRHDTPAGDAHKSSVHIREDQTLNLTAQWNKTDDALKITYRLQNQRSNRVLCFTYLYREKPSGERVIDPTCAFVNVDQNGHLRVDVLVPELPEDMDVESPVVPYAEIVEPGAETSRLLVLPLPLKENDPYAYGPPPTLPRESKTAELRVGYMECPEDDVPGKEIDFEGKTVYSVRAAVAFQRQKIVTTSPVSVAVPIAQPHTR